MAIDGGTSVGSLPKRLLGPVGRILQTGDPAATIDRLFESQHVEDLRLIVAFASVGVLVVFLVGVPLSVANVWSGHRDWTGLHIVFSALGRFLAFFTPALGVFGAVLAWAYQAGSERLGVVDLFACEITTLCRVVTLVDSVGRSVEMFFHGSSGRNGTKSELPARHFTSEENYFPVFENNTSDLQSLEARVVANITAFYTYMKAVRDSARSLMDMSASAKRPEPTPGNGSIATPWQDAARNVIYMMFLALESARFSIKDLVEFEPDEAERSIVILISELEAYRFLRNQFADPDDIRHQRLVLRDAAYRQVVPRLCRIVEAGRASESALSADGVDKPSQWEPAVRLLPELKRRYDAVMSQRPYPSRRTSIAPSLQSVGVQANVAAVSMALRSA